MSNMTSVKSALDAEIKHAKEGIAFYSMRIATLEKMIAQLDQLVNPIASTHSCQCCQGSISDVPAENAGSLSGVDSACFYSGS